MKGIRISIILFCTSLLFSNVHAAGNQGTNKDMKQMCDVLGGTFTSTIEGNWSCCFPDWGCAGCIQKICKIKCETQRCRRANGQAALQAGHTKPEHIKVKFEGKGLQMVVPKVSENPTNKPPRKFNKGNAPVNQIKAKI